MKEIKLKWGADGENKYITADDIKPRILVNTDTKEINNSKTFFREIIYLSFLHGWDTTIMFEDNQEHQEFDANNIIKELAELCNKELQSIKNEPSEFDDV